MCCVLNDLIQEGCVTKLADDLCCGSNSPERHLSNWRRVLDSPDHFNLCLSPTKTIICPKSTTILSWIWSQGNVSASLHCITVLSSCPPQSVKGLSSFIAAYNALGHMLPNCSNVVDPLECALTGLQFNDKLLWDRNLTLRFKTTQEHISRHMSMHCSSSFLQTPFRQSLMDPLPREALLLHCLSPVAVVFT